MKSLKEYIKENQDEQQLSDVQGKWTPKEGTFSGNDPMKIKNYLMKSSNNDEGLAMKRLVFYMNRGGSNIQNKLVLDKVKELLLKEKK